MCCLIPVSWDHCNEHANASDSWCGWVCGSVAVACGGWGVTLRLLNNRLRILGFSWHTFDRARCTVESDCSQDLALPVAPWLCSCQNLGGSSKKKCLCFPRYFFFLKSETATAPTPVTEAGWHAEVAACESSGAGWLRSRGMRPCCAGASARRQVTTVNQASADAARNST